MQKKLKDSWKEAIQLIIITKDYWKRKSILPRSKRINAERNSNRLRKFKKRPKLKLLMTRNFNSTRTSLKKVLQTKLSNQNNRIVEEDSNRSKQYLFRMIPRLKRPSLSQKKTQLHPNQSLNNKLQRNYQRNLNPTQQREASTSICRPFSKRKRQLIKRKRNKREYLRKNLRWRLDTRSSFRGRIKMGKLSWAEWSHTTLIKFRRLE